MVTAYVMIKANTGDVDRVKGELLDLPGVESVHVVAGDLDFVVKVVADSPADVKDVAATALQDVAGVEDTETYVSMS